jgi:hypothetical protein
LMVQILAPIAACWAASIAASDPLSAAAICRDSGDSYASSSRSPTDQPGGHHVHDGGCCVSCGSHAPAALDGPHATAYATPHQHVLRVLWHAAALTLSGSRSGSHAQARAPPSIS